MSMNKKLDEKKASTKDAVAFLKYFLIDELEELIQKKGQPYLKFIPLITGMEFLGACYDEEAFEQEGLSKRRFKKTLFLMGDKYKLFDGSQKQKYPCFYEDFRCPMIHQFRTNQNKFKLTTLQYDYMDDERKKYHLSMDGDIYIIILQELYKDFKEAVLKTIYKIEINELNVKKLKESHVVIRDMGFLSTT